MVTLKSKLKNDDLTIGSWITLGHPAIAEIMSRAGFDWLTVDMEHSAITFHQAQQLIQVIDLAGGSPLVRVSVNDPNLIKRSMDAGAHGVIVPMVNSQADAEQAVASVRYPPHGRRGVGLSRAQGYGLDFAGYAARNQSDSVVIVQVEHIESVNNLASILSVEGVDGFIIGPYDLSGSLGMPGQFDHPEVIAALAEVEKISADFDVVRGFHVIPPDPGEVEKKIKQKYRFIAYSLDSLFLAATCEQDLKTIANLKSDW